MSAHPPHDEEVAVDEDCGSREALLCQLVRRRQGK